MKNKRSMSSFRIIQIITVIAVSFGYTLFSMPVKAADSVYVVVEYIKVLPDDHIKYLEVEQKIWKPMHQERIKEGIIASWTLYAVEFTGSANAYNYVAITTYNDPKNIENPWDADIPARVHSNLTVEDIVEKTNKVRVYVGSELYHCKASMPVIPLKAPAQYIQVNFMKVEPGKQTEYEMLEKEIWMPIHQESIRSGKTIGWGLLAALFPRGAGRPYQYITLNTFSDYSYVFGLDFSIPFKSIHPDKDYNEMTNQTRMSRIIVQSELWDLIDYVVK